MTPNFAPKFAASAQQRKPSQVTAATFLQGAEQPASLLRWTHSDLLYSMFMTLKSKSRDTQALSAVLRQQKPVAPGLGTSTFSSRCHQKAHCAAAEIVPDEKEPAPKPECSTLYRQASCLHTPSTLQHTAQHLREAAETPGAEDGL